MTRPSLGVIFHPLFPPEVLVNYAHRAEAAGFDELWLWEDCFFAGAFTSAATLLASTDQIKVGIGILPATVRNPLFAAMEITTLARLYPGRFMPGFGHGVESWMKQIGSAPHSSLTALEETVGSVRALLNGECVTFQGKNVQLDNVQMNLTAPQLPPLYVGAIREKSLRLAGRVGDGTILTEMASPAYVRWARERIQQGMDEAHRLTHSLAVFVFAKVNPDGSVARQAVRPVLAKRLESAAPHLQPLGIAEEAQRLYREYGIQGAAEQMPDAWLDELSVSGTPQQAAATIERLTDAGAQSVILLPLEGDPTCLDEYIQYLLPALK